MPRMAEREAGTMRAGGARRRPSAMRPPAAPRHGSPEFLQRQLGNRAFQSTSGPVLQRACACGGTCAHCRKEEERGIRVQHRLRVGTPGDRWEREADQVADRVMGASAPAQGIAPQRLPSASAGPVQASGAAGGTAELPSPWSSRILSLRGGGSPLHAGARGFMEERFGHDFGGVRVHTGASAAQAADAVQARAFTLGRDIFFAPGEYRPESASGRHLIAHELTHKLQQDGSAGPARESAVDVRQAAPAGTVSRLKKEMCASSSGTCGVMEGTDGPKGKYLVTVFTDKEGPFLGIPLTSKVGHAWVRLTNASGEYWSYGFWPQEGFDPSEPGTDVDGCVHSPDGPRGWPPHHPSASQTFEITAAQFSAAQAYAQSTCTANPPYNLFGLNCADFTRRVLAAAGQGPGMGFGLIWESPNALASWIRSNSLLLGAGLTGATSAEGGAGAGSFSLQLTYTHQFYSVLGNRLRLYGLGAGEYGGGMKSLTAGAGAELTAQRVYLPSLYLYGAGTAGDLSPGADRFGAGLAAGGGLRFNVDELATVGVEYSLVKDLVNRDPELHRLMFMAGIRLW